MNTALKIFRGALATVAVVVIMGSPNLPEAVPPTDRTTAMVMAFLVFLSVAFLHRLLVRYVTAADLLSTGEHGELLRAGEVGCRRGFFAETDTVGFLLVLLYASWVAGFPLHVPGTPPFGSFLLGVVFLFLGLLARARGIVISLLSSHRELSRPGA